MPGGPRTERCRCGMIRVSKTNAWNYIAKQQTNGAHPPTRRGSHLTLRCSTEAYNRLSAQLDAQVAQIGKQNQLSVGGVGDPFSPLLVARSEAVTAARNSSPSREHCVTMLC